MPQFIFMGVKKHDLINISQDIATDLSTILGTTRKGVVLNLNETTNIFDGEVTTPPTTVDVHWFDRPQEIQDACAEVINSYLTNLGYSDIEIIFHAVSLNKCYFNGKHF